MADTVDSAILERLFAVIERRRGDDPAASYTAKLLKGGTGAIAKKLGEEATETIIAALEGGKDEIVKESADILYHLLVLWADRNVAPGEVWAELARREGTSGIEEKRNRPAR